MMTNSNRFCLPPLWLTLLPEEPPHGAYLRLAERNGYRRISLLEKTTGVKLPEVQRGRDLDRLATMLRCELGELKKYANEVPQAPPRPGQRLKLVPEALWVVAGQAVRRNDLMRGYRRVCPKCVSVSPHHRFWWDLRFVATCPRHEVQLINDCSCGRKLTWLGGSPTKCQLCEEGDVRRRSVAPAGDVTTLTAVDKWILGRFGIMHRGERIPIIDRLPLGVGMEIVERVGALVVGGYRKRWQQITSFTKPPEEVRAIGFAALAKSQLNEVLDRAYEGFRSSGSDRPASLGTMYGWFWHWLCYQGGAAFSDELAAELIRHAQGRI